MGGETLNLYHGIGDNSDVEKDPSPSMSQQEQIEEANEAEAMRQLLNEDANSLSPYNEPDLSYETEGEVPLSLDESDHQENTLNTSNNFPPNQDIWTRENFFENGDSLTGCNFSDSPLYFDFSSTSQPQISRLTPSKIQQLGVKRVRKISSFDYRETSDINVLRPKVKSKAMPNLSTVKKRGGIKRRKRKRGGRERNPSNIRCDLLSTEKSNNFTVDNFSEKVQENTAMNLDSIDDSNLWKCSYEELLQKYHSIQLELRHLEFQEAMEHHATSKNDQPNTSTKSFSSSAHTITQSSLEVSYESTSHSPRESYNSLKDGATQSFRSCELLEKSRAIKSTKLSPPVAESLEKALRDRLLLKMKGPIVGANTTSSLKTFQNKKHTQLSSSSSDKFSANYNKAFKLNRPVEKKDTQPVGGSQSNLTLPIVLDKVPEKKFVIFFGDESSSNDEDVESPRAKDPVCSMEAQMEKVPGLDSLIQEARLLSSRVSENSDKNRSSKPEKLFKLTAAQQEEYRKLKEEISKREKRMNLSSEEHLREAERKWKKIKDSIHLSTIKLKTIDTKLNTKRVALHKAKVRTKKLFDLYIKTTQKVKTLEGETQSLNKELSNIKLTLSSDEVSAHSLAKECIEIGSKLKGKEYRLPHSNSTLKSFQNKTLVSVKTSKKEEESPIAKKKRIMEMRKAVNRKLALTRQRVKIAIKRKKDSKLVRAEEKKKEFKDVEKMLKCQERLQKDIERFKKPDQALTCVPFSYYTKFLIYQIDYSPRLTSTVPFENIPLSMSDIFSIKDFHKSKKGSSSVNLSSKMSGTVLSHLRSFRLSSCYENLCLRENNSVDFLSPSYANSIHPFWRLCHYDLLGTCNDEDCGGQHRTDYMSDQVERLVDIIKYQPSIIGLNGNLSDYNNDMLRKTVEKMCTSNEGVENFVNNLVNKLRESLKFQSIAEIEPAIPRCKSPLKAKLMLPTFEDYNYKIKIRDRKLVLTFRKIFQIKSNVDPDLHIKSRFYAPEERPISAELETALAEDPKDIKLWLNLAFYHLTRNPSRKTDCISRALYVLSRALESNQINCSSASEDDWNRVAGLWENFLYLYANRNASAQDGLHDLSHICEQAVKFCPHFRVWQRYLSLCVKYRDKQRISDQYLAAIEERKVVYSDAEQASHSILQLVLFKVGLFLEVGRPNKAKSTLRECLLDQLVSTDSELKTPLQIVENICELKFQVVKEGVKCSRLASQLAPSDKIYAWLCYIHLLYTNQLPHDTFKSFGQSFCELGSKEPFIINWNLQSIKDIQSLLLVFHSSLFSCFHPDENNSSQSIELCSPIFANLSLIDTLMHNRSNIYAYLIEKFPKVTQFWILYAQTEAHLGNSAIAIKILKEAPGYQEKDISILALVITISYELNLYKDAMEEIIRLLSNYYVCDITDVNVRLAFDILMNDNYIMDEPMKNQLKSKIINRSHLLWLCYLYFQLISPNQDVYMESIFRTAINICKLNLSFGQESLLNSLWCLYIRHFIPANKEPYQVFQESLRHFVESCDSLNDDFFQVKLVQFFARFLSSPIQKFHLFIDFVKFLPRNILLLTETLSYGLELSQQEMCHDLVKNILTSKERYERFTVNLWKKIIALAIHCEDHYAIHRSFQLALSSYPYNCDVWKMMLMYEDSVNHTQHIEEAKKTLAKLILPLHQKGNVFPKPN